ncbi:MAG TPA: hypothetical protein VI874_03355, partial [Candidatus Norongarragalinales archaeon]|nr:hypothetical protein [Candidatus Norongarragalinales archaeon]
WPGATLAEKLDAKTKFLQKNAAQKARPLAIQTRNPIQRLRAGVDAVARASPKNTGPHERIAQEHQRIFVSKTRVLQRQLDALAFPEDFDGLSRAELTFSSTLAAINGVVKDNRYIYAFFERDVTEFNAAMKELLTLDAAMHQILEFARVFSRQCETLKRRRADSSIHDQIARVERDLKDTQGRLQGLKTEQEQLRLSVDSQKIAVRQAELSLAKKAENDAAQRFYAVLEALERPLKRYAHGKEPGAYAGMAERYLRVKEDFLKDCLLDSEELELLLGVLPLEAQAARVSEFRQNKNAWADEFENAREKTTALEKELQKMHSPVDQLDALGSSVKELQTLQETLWEKSTSLSKKISQQEIEAEQDAQLLLQRSIHEPEAAS